MMWLPSVCGDIKRPLRWLQCSQGTRGCTERMQLGMKEMEGQRSSAQLRSYGPTTEMNQATEEQRTWGNHITKSEGKHGAGFKGCDKESRSL